MHELAVYLHLDEATVNKLVAAGKIPSIQLDRQWRFKRSRDRRVDRGAARRRRRELRRRARRHEAAARGSAAGPGDHHEPARDARPVARDRGARGARVHERLARRQAVVRRRRRRARVAVVDGDGGRRRVPAHAREGQGQDRAAVHDRRPVVGGHPVRRARRQPDLSVLPARPQVRPAPPADPRPPRARAAQPGHDREAPLAVSRPTRCARCCSRRTPQVRAGHLPGASASPPARSSPSSIAQLRLRAIRRLQTQKKAETARSAERRAPAAGGEVGEVRTSPRRTVSAAAAARRAERRPGRCCWWRTARSVRSVARRGDADRLGRIAIALGVLVDCVAACSADARGLRPDARRALTTAPRTSLDDRVPPRAAAFARRADSSMQHVTRDADADRFAPVGATPSCRGDRGGDLRWFECAGAREPARSSATAGAASSSPCDERPGARRRWRCRRRRRGDDPAAGRSRGGC